MNLFTTNHISRYLKARMGTLPGHGRGEARRIAEALGVSSTLISQILSGEKFLTLEQAQSLSDYLGHNSLERDYFIFLAQLERAGSAGSKKYWHEKLLGIRGEALKVSKRVEAKRILSDEERSIFYSSPLYSAIRLFTSTRESGRTLTDICARFDLPRPRATELMHFLVQAGLCRFERERYLMGPQSTHLEHGSPYLLKHHSNWRIRALAQSETLGENELMYTAPVSLSREDFQELRERMVVFIKDFLKTVHASPAEDIACLNLDFFWIRK